MNDPCGEAAYVHGSVPGRTTIRWPGPDAVDWNRKAEQIYWRNFSINGANAIGHCKTEALFSPIIYIQECNCNIEYQWNEDPATGNIEIVINSISLRIPPVLSKGGTAVIVIPMLEAEVSGNKIRTRANKSFIAGIYTNEGKAAKSTALQQLNSTTHYEVCRFVPLHPSVQQVNFNCLCGMEQVFFIRNENGLIPLVIAITEL